jgi:hypothetical protein
VLKTIESRDTWGAFCLVGHQDMGWLQPHSIGGGAIRDAQRHQEKAMPVRVSKIKDDDLITAIEAFKESNDGERRGLNENLTKHFGVSARTIISRLKAFTNKNPMHDLTLFINDQ